MTRDGTGLGQAWEITPAREIFRSLRVTLPSWEGADGQKSGGLSPGRESIESIDVIDSIESIESVESVKSMDSIDSIDAVEAIDSFL